MLSECIYTASGGGGSAYDFHYEIVADGGTVTKTVDSNKLVYATQLNFSAPTYTNALYRDENDVLQDVGNNQHLVKLNGNTLSFGPISSGNKIIAWAESV